MKTLIIVALLLPLSLAAQSPQPTPTSVFVFAADSHDTGEYERQLFVEAVKKSLPTNKQISNQIAIAATREAATIAVEISEAAEEDRQSATATRIEVFVHPVYAVAAALTFGAYSTALPIHVTEQSYRKTINSGRFNTPDSMGVAVKDVLRLKAAAAMSESIREWIALNQAELKR